MLCLIDTGAETSLCSESALFQMFPNRLPIYEQESAVYKSLTGHSLTPLGRMTVKFDDIPPTSLLVVRDISHSCILGMSLLAAGKYVLSNDKLILFGKEYKLFPYHNKFHNSYISSLNCSSDLDHKLSIIMEKYKRLFSEKLMPKPIKTSIKFDVVTYNENPVRCQPYRTPLARQHIVEKQIQEMVESGVLSPGTSEYSSPVHLVKKKDGNFRLVANFQALNAVTVPDAYPLMPIQQIFDSLTNSAVYTTLDALKGYFQVDCTPRTRLKCAIVTQGNLYLHNRMGMGLKNAGATFCRIMNEILGSFIGKFVYVYMDDIVIYSKNMEDHLEHLDIVFKKLLHHNVQLRKSKCKIAQQQVELLGFVISREGVSTKKEKLDPIVKAPPPKGKKSLQSFLGSVNYYRKFIPNYSQIATPLYNLVKKNVVYKWGSEHQSAYDSLKSYLVDTPILAYPDINKPFRLETDASDIALGSVLRQTDDKGCHRVIQYHSRRFSNAEKRYSTIEKECLAIVESLKHFRPVITGCHVDIYSDHKPLLALTSKNIQNRRIQNWASILADYDCTIRHVPGHLNHFSDYLSRNVIELDTLDSSDYVITPRNNAVLEHIPIENDNITYLDLINEQRKDFEHLYDDPDNVVVEGVLYSMRRPTRLDLRYPRLLLPRKYVSQVLKNCHELLCHSGIHKCLNNLRMSYVWKGMRRDLIDYIGKCGLCQINKRIHTNRRHYSSNVLFTRNQCVGVDLIGPLMESPGGNRYIFTAIDHTTRWAIAVPIPNKQAKTVRDAFYNHYICHHGIPNSIVSDNAREFQNVLFIGMCNTLGIKNRRICPFSPTGNSICERVNKTIKDMVRKLCNNDSSKWEEQLHSAMFAYRCTLHEATMTSPFYMNYGTLPRLPHLTPVDSGMGEEEWLKSLTAAFQVAKETTNAMMNRNRARMNAKATEPDIKIGDICVFKNMTRVKLQSQNRGVYQVIDKKTPVIFMRHLYDGSVRMARSVHVRPVDPSIILNNINLDPVKRPISPNYLHRFVDIQLLPSSIADQINNDPRENSPLNDQDIPVQVEESDKEIVGQTDENVADNIVSPIRDINDTEQNANSSMPPNIFADKAEKQIVGVPQQASTPEDRQRKFHLHRPRRYCKYKLRRRIQKPAWHKDYILESPYE